MNLRELTACVAGMQPEEQRRARIGLLEALRLELLARVRGRRWRSALIWSRIGLLLRSQARCGTVAVVERGAYVLVEVVA